MRISRESEGGLPAEMRGRGEKRPPARRLEADRLEWENPTTSWDDVPKRGARIMGRDRRGVKSIFDEAAEIASPEDRAAYLDSTCDGDAGLRKMVDTLLRTLDEAGMFLEATPALEAEDPTLESVELLGAYGDRPRHHPEAEADAGTLSGQEPRSDDTMEGSEPALAQGPTASYRPASTPGSPIGSVIAGRYKLREPIGDGGMGTVYLAEQTRPVKRKVALKLIREGMGSEAVAARFELERQALALMDHPNIAKVFDAGTTESGARSSSWSSSRGSP